MAVNNGQIKGIITYLIKLTHTVNEFRFKFTNVNVNYVTKGMKSQPEIQYDLEITPKQSDIPFMWDFFSCKSKHIIEEGCEMVSVNFGEVFTNLNNIYYNGKRMNRYGGNIPASFIQKISDNIQQLGPKQIKGFFWCGGEKKQLSLNITYKLSDVFIEDGITTDVSVYCHQVLVDGEPLENIPQDLAETIVGYMTESDDLRRPLDGIVWDEVTKYMDLEDCELWTHTYTYIRNIGDIEIDDYNYVNHSIFSSKLCDFISGDY
jgi:hypothetical protein